MESRALQASTPRRLIYWTLLPVVICELALFPFWFGGTHNNPGVGDAQLFVTVFVLPSYLATVASVFASQCTLRGVVFTFATLLVSVALAVFLAYAAWGISTRRFWAPDYETIFIMRQAGMVALAVASAPPIATLAVRFITLYARRNA